MCNLVRQSSPFSRRNNKNQSSSPPPQKIPIPKNHLLSSVSNLYISTGVHYSKFIYLSCVILNVAISRAVSILIVSDKESRHAQVQFYLKESNDYLSIELKIPMLPISPYQHYYHRNILIIYINYGLISTIPYSTYLKTISKFYIKNVPSKQIRIVESPENNRQISNKYSGKHRGGRC